MQEIFRWVPGVLLGVVLSSTGASASQEATDESASNERLASLAKYGLSDLLQPPSATADQRQRESFAQMADSLANESFTEAEIIAKNIVEQVDSSVADAAFARSRALHNLAIVQHHAGNHEAAIQNYGVALSVVAAADNNLSSSLILPLRGLAIAHIDQERPTEGFAALDRAQHISDVNYGPHSFEQMPLLNAKMRLFAEHDDKKSALDVVDRIYGLYTRQYAMDSEELLPALYSRATLYERFNMDTEERIAWRHILAIKQEALPKNDPDLIEPNLKLAAIYTRAMRSNDFRTVLSSKAEKHFKRALWIAENSPDGDWERRKDCLLALADYYMLFEFKPLAHRHYSSAWDLLSSNEQHLPVRARHLEQPVRLTRPQLNRYAKFEQRRDEDEVGPDDFEEGEMTVVFTVNESGRPEDVEIVQANPPNFARMEKRVRNTVEKFVYRPRYVNGEPVATNDQRYRARYFYIPSEYKAAIESNRSRRGPNR